MSVIYFHGCGCHMTQTPPTVQTKLRYDPVELSGGMASEQPLVSEVRYSLQSATVVYKVTNFEQVHFSLVSLLQQYH